MPSMNRNTESASSRRSRCTSVCTRSFAKMASRTMRNKFNTIRTRSRYQDTCSGFQVSPNLTTIGTAAKTSSSSDSRRRLQQEHETRSKYRYGTERNSNNAATPQRLTYAANQVEDDRHLRRYNMRNGSTAHLTLRLRGGNVTRRLARTHKHPTRPQERKH